MTTTQQPAYVWPDGDIDFMSAAAFRKLGETSDWRVYKWEKVDYKSETPDFIVEGGVPRLLKSGPRKGQPTFRDCVGRRTVVTWAEIQKAKSDYEAETGKCCECFGTGQYCYGWSRDEGNKYRDCGRCSATGKSPQVEDAVHGQAH